MDAAVIRFGPEQANQLLLNPRMEIGEKKRLEELQLEFEKHFGATGYFLVASSGSSKKADESVKLIALHYERVLNSASRFNAYYGATSEDNWGLVLPLFHVAGLGIEARAFLTQAKVFTSDWAAALQTDWISANEICYISLVPAQVFDLVSRQIRCPNSLKKVFVGGGQLTEFMRRDLTDLGWPVVETYGMTETASMIAVKENDFFELLPGVQVRQDSQGLSVQCNSLLTAFVQQAGNQTILRTFRDDDWYPTEDQVEIVPNEPQVRLKLMGRWSEYVKILGEGVSLSEIRARMESLFYREGIAGSQYELVALDDARAGSKLYLVMEESVSGDIAEALMGEYHRFCRAYEKVSGIFRVGRIPRTELGKLKMTELKSILAEMISRGGNGKSE